MKRFLLLLLFFALPCFGQTNPLFLQSAFNTAPAATPTFSPASGYSGGATTVTASTTTSACSSYIYFGTANPPTVNASTYSFAATITLYAYVHGCPGYNDSAVATWTGTLTASMAVLGTPTSCGSTVNFIGSVTCAISSTPANAAILVAYNLQGGAVEPTITGCSDIGTPASTNVGFIGLCVIPSPSAGTTSVTVTFNNNYSTSSILVAVVSGVQNTSPIDTSTGITNNTMFSEGNASAWTGSVTTTNAQDVILGVVAADVTAFTAGTGYTAVGTSNYYSGNPIFLEYLNVSSTGSYNPGVTWTPSNAQGVGTGALELQ